MTTESTSQDLTELAQTGYEAMRAAEDAADKAVTAAAAARQAAQARGDELAHDIWARREEYLARMTVQIRHELRHPGSVS